MADDAPRLTTSLQESALTLLAFDSDQGALAMGMVTAAHFDDTYRDIAGKIITYRKRYGKPPGAAHLDDLFDDVLTNPDHRQHKLYLRVIEGLLEQSRGLNAAYVASRVTEFVRQQSLKVAVHEAAQRYQQSGDDLVADVENILFKALKLRVTGVGGGIFLDDKDTALGFLERPAQALPLGIPQFDRVNAGPTPGTLLLFLAAKGRGKSWFATHCAKQALLQGEKVVHITLEMPEEQVIQRYFQTMFAIGVRNEEFIETRLVLDKLGRLSGIDFARAKPKLNFQDRSIQKILRGEMAKWGSRLGRIVVKEFPPDQLTIAQLNAYLDGLEQVHGFIPNMLIIDYPDLMQLGDRTNLRESTGQMIKSIRGVLSERKLKGVAPSQTNRASTDAATVKESHVAEDFSKLQTADKAIIYSQTPEEKKLKLARLYLDKNRGDKDDITVLIAQNYETGQFVLGKPVMMGKNYFDLVKQANPPDRND